MFLVFVQTKKEKKKKRKRLASWKQTGYTLVFVCACRPVAAEAAARGVYVYAEGEAAGWDVP